MGEDESLREFSAVHIRLHGTAVNDPVVLDGRCFDAGFERISISLLPNDHFLGTGRFDVLFRHRRHYQ